MARLPPRRGAPPSFIEQGGVPVEEADSGGVKAMIRRYANPSAIGELTRVMTDTANVKRHNTSAWITSRIKNAEYAPLPVLLEHIRSQHGLDAAAMAKTQQRAARIVEWLEANPQTKMLDADTLNNLAGSTGALKVGWGGGSKFITLDGVGRVEAVRMAMASYKQAHGTAHPLCAVESFGVRLTDDEYGQLYHTSTYSLDESGRQRESHQHDLMPFSALPRLIGGTAMNAVKQAMFPDDPEQRPDRRLPVQVAQLALDAIKS